MTIGDKLAAQQREQQAQAFEWEKRREAGRAWAYSRAGLPVPDGDATDAPREATRTITPEAREARRAWEASRARGRTWGPEEPAVMPTQEITRQAVRVMKGMLPEPPVIARARALLAAREPWDSIPIDKADLAELVALAVAP